MKKFTRTDVEKMLNTNIPNLAGKILYIYGGGDTTNLYQNGLKREFFWNQIMGYCNSNPENWGKIMFGKTCVSPDSLKEKDNVLVLINTPRPNYIKEMKKILSELRLDYCLLDEAILKNHAAETLAVYDMLEDDASKMVYANMLWCRLNGECPDVDIICKNIYFDSWKTFSGKYCGGKNYVDCGAYCGDTLEKYIYSMEGIINKVWAFEPDSNNFRAMKYRSERLEKEWNLYGKIELMPFGVSDKSTDGVVQRYGENNGVGSKICEDAAADGENLKIVALDDVIKEKVDFIKADIESFEYKMLLGAENLIKQNKPSLAICIYHNATDFYSVPLLIKKMMPDAHFAARHDSLGIAGTVVFAYI